MPIDPPRRRSHQSHSNVEPPRPLGPDVRRALRDRLLAALGSIPEPADGILLLDHANVVWASGFDHSASERPVGLYLSVDADPVLYVPYLEIDHARDVDGVDVEAYEEFPGHRHPVRWMFDRIADRSPRSRRYAIDALDTRVHAALRGDGRDVFATDVVAAVRAVKEPAELALVRSAASFADRCLHWILEHGGPTVAAGGSELDILQGGVNAARRAMNDALGEAFPATQLHVVGTVHTGPRAALPHGRTGQRAPTAGEVLIAGIGAKVGGYHAESGATFVLGTANDDQALCLAAADSSRLAAIDAVASGASCQSVHDAAMAVLTSAGFEPYLRHRIGHGMGVEGHEAPWLAPGDDTPIGAGMVFSNEPGIYRPGVDGYRTIDSMIVHDDGVELPSRFQSTVPWDHRVLPLD